MVNTCSQELASDNKLRGVLEYCLVLLGNSVPKTKLFKVVYLSDFGAYYFTGEPISGHLYKKRDHGPVADTLFALVDEMVSSREMAIKAGNKAKFHSLITEPKYIDLLTDEQKQIVKEVCNEWKSKKTEVIENFTHNQRPWALSKKDEIIPYELILQEEHPYIPVA